MSRQDFSPVQRRSERSLRQQLIEVGQVGDEADPPRWLPAAFTEKNVSTFFDVRLDSAKYAIFVELLELNEAALIRDFTAGAREINKHLERDLDRWLQRMSNHVVDIFSATARQRRLVEWLSFTDWGGDAARQALRDYRRAEYTASMEAFRTMESAMHREVRARTVDRFVTPEIISLMSWVLCRDDKKDPTIHDFLTYLQSGRPVAWGGVLD